MIETLFFEYRFKWLLYSIFNQSHIEAKKMIDGVVYDYYINDYGLLVDIECPGEQWSTKSSLAYLNGMRYLSAPRDIKEARDKLLATISNFKTALTINTSEIVPILTPRLSGDAGWDIITSDDTVCRARSCTDVPSDLFMEMPHQIYGVVQARSSTSKRGLLVLPGVIDPSYRGRIYAMVYNLTEEDLIISRGDRIAQMLFFQRVPGLHMSSATHLMPSERSTRGFGSTGKGMHDIDEE